MLAFAVARLGPHVRSNAVDPGWVSTKMGGPSAPDDLEQGVVRQVWLAVSDQRGAKVSGQIFLSQADSSRSSGGIGHHRPEPVSGRLRSTRGGCQAWREADELEAASSCA